MRKKMIWLIPAVPAAAFLMMMLLFYIGSGSADNSDPRNRPHAYFITNEVVIDRNVSTVFNYIQSSIPDIYRELTDMHDTFEIINADRLITTMDVYVHFDFLPETGGRTKLMQTIVMKPSSPAFKAFLDTLAFLTGNKETWAEQFRDELVNFKPLIEKYT